MISPALTHLLPEHLPAHWQRLTEECAAARAEAKEWKEIAIRAQTLLATTRPQLHKLLGRIDEALDAGQADGDSQVVHPVLKLRFTDGQKVAIEAAAADAGLTVQTWARAALLRLAAVGLENVFGASEAEEVGT